MSPSITSSFTNFFHTLASIGLSLFKSILAVLTAILGLGQNILGSVLELGQSILKLGLDLFQGVFGFVAANIVVICVLGACYYFYTRRQRRNRIGG